MVRQTRKQRQIMSVIFRAAGEGMFLNIRELHARLPYTCHYGSLRRSIEFLERDGVLVKESAGRSTLLKPTQYAYALFGSGA